MLGDNPSGFPSNLFPYIMKVAIGQKKEVKIFGNDYNTPDGTGIRDYIHIMDLVDGHIAAMQYLETTNATSNYENINLGAGRGYSVIEILESFKEINNIEIPYKFVNRRDGDVDASYANISKAKSKLKWKPKRTLRDMCASAWSFEKNQSNFL
jgi:UDP-glucose 4-epimerase